MNQPRSERDALLDALNVERHNGGGWVRRKPLADHDIACAQRRRLLAEKVKAFEDRRSA